MTSPPSQASTLGCATPTTFTRATPWVDDRRWTAVDPDVHTDGSDGAYTIDEIDVEPCNPDCKPVSFTDHAPKVLEAGGETRLFVSNSVRVDTETFAR